MGNRDVGGYVCEGKRGSRQARTKEGGRGVE